jgi:hypothetical protein
MKQWGFAEPPIFLPFLFLPNKSKQSPPVSGIGKDLLMDARVSFFRRYNNRL